MATIIEFRRHARARKEGLSFRDKEHSGEVVIFPGVRIERHEGEIADTTSEPRDECSKREQAWE